MSTSALLLIDCQNDFLHAQGAYGRAGQVLPDAAQLVAQIGQLCDGARATDVAILASRFTLWPGRDDEPLIAEHLRHTRPFLAKGDFAEGSWGHACVDAVGVPNAYVDKVAYSAFAHTRLGWLVEKWDIDCLVVAGIVTNGGVASTVRDAHVRELRVEVVSDACSAFDPAVHTATITSLGSIVSITTVAAQVAAWKRVGRPSGKPIGRIST